MKITRNVILDLLPLYLADEVSDETRLLVEKYLETDPELADIAAQTVTTKLLEDIPVPLTKEHALEAYKEARRLMLLRTLGLAIVISLTFLCVLAMLILAVLAALTLP